MHVFEVGQPYIAGRTRWQQGPIYNYCQDVHELLLCVDHPVAEEIDGVRVGVAEFALLVERDALFLLHRFGTGSASGLPWGDASYNWWLNKPESRTLPTTEQETGERVHLHIRLIDAQTGVIQALRLVSLSTEFTSALHKAIWKQSRTRWEGEQAYDKALNRLYRKYPTADSMLAQASVRCMGGE